MTDRTGPLDEPTPVRWRGQGVAADPGGWLNAGLAEVVKHGPHRTVYRVRLPGLSVYWKRCRLSGVRAWLRQLIRPQKARLEFDRAMELRRRGVPTVEPLAWGGPPRWQPGESHLLTRELADSVPLHDALESVRSCPARRQALTEELGRFLAGLHDRGVTHPDPHPGNFLTRSDGPGPITFYLLDLHAIRLTGPLPWPAARENLTLFNRWFVMRATRTDRLRFWLAYVRHRKTGLPTDLRAAAKDLEDRTRSSNRRFWKSRDRRCLGQNRYFRRLRSSAATGFAVRGLDDAVCRELLADPDAPFARPGVRILKDSRSSTVAEWEIPTADGPRAVIYKRFRVVSRWEPIRNLVRRSPALRSWVMGHGLIHRGLPTPEPLLVLHRVRHGLRREGYLLTEKVPAARELSDFADPTSGDGRHLLEPVARLVRALHERRVSHRDLKPANVLVNPEPWLIDLVGVRACGRLSFRRRCRDLARLAASFRGPTPLSRSDKLRFLRVYLNAGLHGAADWKTWWRTIDRAVTVKVDRNRKRNRPLT